MPRQFRLRSLFILTAIVAVGCLVGVPIVRKVRDAWFPPKPLPGDLAAMTVGILPLLPVDEMCSWSWYGEGKMGPVEGALNQASPPKD